jgi:hypothetical protein
MEHFLNFENSKFRILHFQSFQILIFKKIKTEILNIEKNWEVKPYLAPPGKPTRGGLGGARSGLANILAH